MFDTLRRNIGITTARFFVRMKAAKSVHFSNAFTNARTALVILPENRNYHPVALPIVRLLREKFYGNRMTLVVPDTNEELTRAFAQTTIVPAGKEQTNVFFLPKQSVLQRLLGQRFDLLVDLNFSAVPCAAYLCRAVDAYVKVGFVKQHADAFYNFQIQSPPDRNPKSRYEQLFRTLSMF